MPQNYCLQAKNPRSRSGAHISDLDRAELAELLAHIRLEELVVLEPHTWLVEIPALHRIRDIGGGPH